MNAKRIVWAVNPFSDEKTHFKRALKLMGEFAAGYGAVVEPVFVLGPPNLYLPVGADLSLLTPARPKFDKVWEKLTKGNKRAELFLEPTLLTNEAISQVGVARALADYAWTVGAEMVAVATHGRKGVARLFMGSFAESLLHQVALPTIVFNPKTEKTGKARNILFPVDLPFDAQSAYEEVLGFAKSLKAQVVLFHKLDYVTEYTASPLFQIPMYQGYLSHDVAARKKELEKLVTQAKAAGVSAKFVLDQGTGYVPDRILSAAKKNNVDLIAMVAKSGRIQSVLLGSVARQVVRTAACPVWVLRTPKVKEKAVPIREQADLASSKSQ